MKFIAILLFCTFHIEAYSQNEIKNEKLHAPDTAGNWIQPSECIPAMPIWGHAKGVSVGLAPLPGPRGLLRIYAPYLNEYPPSVVNFIAFEPIPLNSEERGFSELEKSKLDDVNGKRFWSSNNSNGYNPKSPVEPARGEISIAKGQEVLTVFIHSEKFDNGAMLYIRLRFFENEPYQLELTTYSSPESVKLKNFIVTATMGNKMRLRNLHLKDEKISSLKIWPDYKSIHFTEHAIFPIEKLIHDNVGKVYFITSPNEDCLQGVIYPEGTKQHWKYQGKTATQYWICNSPHAELKGIVNGRFVYWASKSPIPGGISIENFELKEPFRQGATYVFGIDPRKPEEFIEEIIKQ